MQHALLLACQFGLRAEARSSPHLNCSPISPKLARAYPHIVENRGITMAPNGFG